MLLKLISPNHLLMTILTSDLETYSPIPLTTEAAKKFLKQLCYNTLNQLPS